MFGIKKKWPAFPLLNFPRTLRRNILPIRNTGAPVFPRIHPHQDEDRERDCLTSWRRSKRVDVAERTRNFAARTAAARTFGRRLGWGRRRRSGGLWTVGRGCRSRGWGKTAPTPVYRPGYTLSRRSRKFPSLPAFSRHPLSATRFLSTVHRAVECITRPNFGVSDQETLS